jgi:phospholipase/carboxylesterase
VSDSLESVHHITTGLAFDRLGLVHRVRLPDGKGPHPTLLMLHGLNGTEDVTWVFARNAGPDWLIISPRAPFVGENGYRWNRSSDQNPNESNTAPQAYDAGLAALSHFIESLPTIYPVDLSRLVLLGFSQGVAMAYIYGTSHAVAGIAALSGFIPSSLADHLPALAHLPVLILHGVKDETIPVATARTNRDQLLTAGADVTYHEAEVGHKVSSSGMAELKRWLAQRLKV